VLVELSIRNLAIIDSVTLALSPGFNVLTGETGAGKSIIVEALGLLCGGRGSVDDVRTGCEKLVVEGTFDGPEVGELEPILSAQGIDLDDGRVVLRREVTAAGRSRCWVNGVTVTTTSLGAIGTRLINIHGQHDARGLLDPDVQRDIVDRFGAATLERDRVARAFDAVTEVREEIATLTRRRNEAVSRADYLRHVVAEIGDARLVVGEDAKLDEEARRLANVEELRLHIAQGLAALDGEEGSALDALGRARRVLAAAARLDPSLERLAALLEGIVDELKDATREVAHYEAGLEADPLRLAEVERRRDLVYRLQKKHGGAIENVLQTLATAQRELDVLDTAATDLGALSQREVACVQELGEAVQALSVTRAAAATRLGRSVEAVFPELGLVDGHFAVSLVPLEAPTRTGGEDISFVTSLNVGHEARPLARVASGGELSRVMLALTTVLTSMHRVPTLVFDEVDAGVGGRVAMQLGALLQRVSAGHQVLVITHLAQVAARAHAHVVVTKAAEGGVTTADLTVVEGRNRIREVARMLGGDESAASLRHARELLNPLAPAAAPPMRDGKPA
jgi:DNA repair protein RecN (Recombination protein N)